MERTEATGLTIATIGHVALFAALSLGIATRPELREPVESLAVMLTDEVGLEAQSPNQIEPAATSLAPEIGTPEPAPAPAPAAQSPPQREVARPAPTPPRPTQQPRQRSEPQRTTTPPRPTDERQRRRPDRDLGARLGLSRDGATDEASTSTSQTPPAAVAGPAVISSLQRELLRQVKPHWRPPTGADVEALRTKVVARLDRNGNIVGTPTVSTTGRNAANAAQVAIHQERALAAVQRAAPFNFPAEYYDAWQTIEPVLYLGL